MKQVLIYLQRIMCYSRSQSFQSHYTDFGHFQIQVSSATSAFLVIL